MQTQGITAEIDEAHEVETPQDQSQSDDWEELNRVAESMIHTLDRLHLIAREVVGDLRAARQELTKKCAR